MTPKQRRVLLVDDHADSCELFQLFLEGEGYVVKTANDGEEALRILANEPFDAAIIDIGLPDIDGYEVARRARALAPESTYFVAMTGYGSDADRARALAAGFHEQLTKPVEPTRLAATLSRLA